MVSFSSCVALTVTCSGKTPIDAMEGSGCYGRCALEPGRPVSGCSDCGDLEPWVRQALWSLLFTHGSDTRAPPAPEGGTEPGKAGAPHTQTGTVLWYVWYLVTSVNLKLSCYSPLSGQDELQIKNIFRYVP